MSEPTEPNGRWRVTPSLAMSIIGWIVTILLAYGTVNARISVIEAKQNVSDDRLRRMEDKLDRLLNRP